jgi:hypothetical protein
VVSSEQPKADATAKSPREAAARALVACINAQADHGTVRVICPDSASVKAVKDYAEAFFEEKRLKPLLKRMTADGAELVSGVAIEVTANPVRLVRSVICTIELEAAPAAGERVAKEIDPFEIARKFALIARLSALPDASPSIKATARRISLLMGEDEHHVEEMGKLYLAAEIPKDRIFHTPSRSGSGEIIPSAYQPQAQAGGPDRITEGGYYSAEYERARVERRPGSNLISSVRRSQTRGGGADG